MGNEIFVFGLGHLGSFLLKENQNYAMYTILGTKTKSDEHAIPYRLGESLPPGIKAKYKAVVFSFPPKDGYENFLIECDKFFDIETPWIFISSTSAEDYNFFLASLEKKLKKFGRKLAIVRPGGLVDEIRHPKGFFKNKDELTGCETPINLVHTRDVARAILHIIDKGLYGESYNLVSDDHPTKKEFYGIWLGENFRMNPEGSNPERIIDNSKIKSTGFQFKYPQIEAFFRS